MTVEVLSRHPRYLLFLSLLLYAGATPIGGASCFSSPDGWVAMGHDREGELAQ